jgi:membrane protease YdiL (CAAX protease family)
MVGGAALAAVMAQRGAGKASALQIGDIDALMPRNGAESLWAALISLNAGISEELFFRLLLPLLLALLTGNVVAAFAVAALVFGLVHVYQGWMGVLATGFLGLVFSVLYLASGSLIAAMAAHALLDLFGLVVRPTLVRMLRRR